MMLMKGLWIFVFIFIAVFFSACKHKEQSEPPRAFYSEVRSVNKLVLGRMAISKMSTIEDLKLSEAKGMKQKTEALLDEVKIGNRKAAYSYSTYLRAYIDLGELTPEDVVVDDESKTISLTLPAVKTEFLGRDVQIREDHYRVTGLRSNINARERALLKEKMNGALKREVEEKPIYKEKLIAQAQTKAVSYFRSLLGKDGYTVSVNFKSN